MASTSENQQPTTNLPLQQTSSSNYAEAQSGKSNQQAAAAQTVKIPDGRRNSRGEELASPTESWRPNFARTQSWNKEDLKRNFTITELENNKKNAGFTEEIGKKE